MEAVIDKIEVDKYTAYKDSGAEWLGEIPDHWDCIRMKHLFRDVSIKNRPNAELLSVTQDQGVVPRTSVENRMVMPSGNLESFKYIQKGDFAISLRSFEGGLEYCHQDGIISPAYTVLKAKTKIADNYYKYLFKSYSFISEIQTSVVGIREGKNISYEELCYSFMPVPLIEEQTDIANFLDGKTAQIDKAIAQKEKLIELLKERQQILIHKAVTRGLNPNVKMKDSGVEWIGEIPEHWEVKKLKYLVDIKGGFAFESTDFKNEGVQLIRIANTYMNELCLDRQPVFLDYKCLESHRDWVVSKGDILISLTGTLGKRDYGFAIQIENENKYLLNQRVAKISTKGIIKAEYILNILHSEMFLGPLFMLPAGTKQANLSNDNVLNINVAVPSSPQERNLILEFIKDLKKRITKAITNKQQEIEKLKEYKATLINAAVTGKIKVS